MHANVESHCIAPRCRGSAGGHPTSRRAWGGADAELRLNDARRRRAAESRGSVAGCACQPEYGIRDRTANGAEAVLRDRRQRPYPQPRVAWPDATRRAPHRAAHAVGAHRGRCRRDLRGVPGRRHPAVHDGAVAVRAAARGGLHPLRAATGGPTGVEATWAIREGDTLAGMIGLHGITLGGAGELGYWMAAPSRGRGLLTEAARAVIDWGFSTSRRGAAAHRVARGRRQRRVGTRRPRARVPLRGRAAPGALPNSFGRDDGWIAGLLHTDDRMPQPWPVLED